MKTKFKLSNRILSLVLALVLVVGLLPITATEVTALTQESDCYLIANEDDLFEFAQIVNGTHASIAKNTSANAKLTADISMTGESRPWIPIAPSSYTVDAYTGTFDGQGYTISNLYFNDESADNAGLVGMMVGGTVRNVTVSDSSVTAANAGAIVGRAFSGSKIEGCVNRNTAVSGGSVGGIGGYVIGNSTVLACGNTGTLSGERATGGICGYFDGTLRGCWNTGKVTATNWYAGGIVGVVSGSETVTHCYNEGVVTSDYDSPGNDPEGSIIGGSNSTSDPKLSDCCYLRIFNGAWYAYGVEPDYHFSNIEYVSSSVLSSGKVTYLLNQGLTGTGYQFYQNLDNGSPADSYPVLDSSHGTVYYGYIACDANKTYSNSVSATPYHSGITYTKDGVTIKEVCTNQSCANTGSLGSVTLKASDAYYTGNPIAAVVEGSFKNGATHKIAYGNGVETAPSSVGSHTATLTAYENSTEKASVTQDYEISYLESPALSAFSISGHSHFDSEEKIYWFNTGADSIVTAPAGYSISTTRDSGYGDTVIFSESDTKTVYLSRQSDGAKTDAIDLSSILSFDNNAPTGKITLSTGNDWKNLIHKITFGLFFKEAKTATITAQDTESGVRSIQYYVADGDLISDNTLGSAAAIEKLKTAVGAAWNTYSGEISLNGNAKNVVYAKITDNVGNVTYLSSDGIVLYSDATTSTTAVSTTFGAGEDKEILIDLKGNTVKSVFVAEEALIADNDYIVSDGKITLKASYLDTLKAGNYTITVSFNPLGESFVEAGDNVAPAEITVLLNIAKADQAAPTGLAKADTTYFGKADGKISGLTSAMEFRKEGDSTYTAGFNGTLEYLAAGTYYVRYQGDANHNPSPDTAITVGEGRKLQIVVPQNQVGYTVTVNKTEMEYEGSYTLKVEIHEGYTATEDFKIIISNWECGQQAGVEATYMNAIADQIIEVQGVADITAPAAEIKIENNQWTSLWNNLTFGLFFKETQDVTITATDKGSGVKSIEYYLAHHELGSDELEAIANWTEYNGTFKVNPDNRYVIYAKVADNSGNTVYLNSAGIVLDATAPELIGIENNGIYYGDKIFKALDDNFLKIEVDSVDITDTTEGDDEFKIVADNAEHTVTVTDKAGNVTEYKITIYKNYTVTFKADGVTVDTQTVGHGKDATLPAVPAKEGFVGKWDRNNENITSDTTISAVYTAIPVVKLDEVKPDDKTELEDTKKQLKDMLDDNGYTEDDKKDIQEAIDNIDDALKAIENVEAVEDKIGSLPETITMNDEEAIKAADDAYHALSDYEKSLVDEDVKKALDDAKAALAKLGEPADTTSPNTGDNSNIWLWVALLFISGGAVITLTVVDRKKRTAQK